MSSTHNESHLLLGNISISSQSQDSDIMSFHSQPSTFDNFLVESINKIFNCQVFSFILPKLSSNTLSNFESLWQVEWVSRLKGSSALDAYNRLFLDKSINLKSDSASNARNYLINQCKENNTFLTKCIPLIIDCLCARLRIKNPHATFAVFSLRYNLGVRTTYLKNPFCLPEIANHVAQVAYCFPQLSPSYSGHRPSVHQILSEAESGFVKLVSKVFTAFRRRGLDDEESQVATAQTVTVESIVMISCLYAGIPSLLAFQVLNNQLTNSSTPKLNNSFKKNKFQYELEPKFPVTPLTTIMNDDELDFETINHQLLPTFMNSFSSNQRHQFMQACCIAFLRLLNLKETTKSNSSSLPSSNNAPNFVICLERTVQSLRTIALNRGKVGSSILKSDLVPRAPLVKRVELGFQEKSAAIIWSDVSPWISPSDIKKSDHIANKKGHALLEKSPKAKNLWENVRVEWMATLVGWQGILQAEYLSKRCSLLYEKEFGSTYNNDEEINHYSRHLPLNSNKQSKQFSVDKDLFKIPQDNALNNMLLEINKNQRVVPLSHNIDESVKAQEISPGHQTNQTPYIKEKILAVTLFDDNWETDSTPPGGKTSSCAVLFENKTVKSAVDTASLEPLDKSKLPFPLNGGRYSDVDDHLEEEGIPTSSKREPSSFPRSTIILGHIENNNCISGLDRVQGQNIESLLDDRSIISAKIDGAMASNSPSVVSKGEFYSPETKHVITEYKNNIVKNHSNYVPDKPVKMRYNAECSQSSENSKDPFILNCSSVVSSVLENCSGNEDYDNIFPIYEAEKNFITDAFIGNDLMLTKNILHLESASDPLKQSSSHDQNPNFITENKENLAASNSPQSTSSQLNSQSEDFDPVSTVSPYCLRPHISPRFPLAITSPRSSQCDPMPESHSARSAVLQSEQKGNVYFSIPLMNDSNVSLNSNQASSSAGTQSNSKIMTGVTSKTSRLKSGEPVRRPLTSTTEVHCLDVDTLFNSQRDALLEIDDNCSLLRTSMTTSETNAHSNRISSVFPIDDTVSLHLAHKNHNESLIIKSGSILSRTALSSEDRSDAIEGKSDSKHAEIKIENAQSRLESSSLSSKHKYSNSSNSVKSITENSGSSTSVFRVSSKSSTKLYDQESTLFCRALRLVSASSSKKTDKSYLPRYSIKSSLDSSIQNLAQQASTTLERHEMAISNQHSISTSKSSLSSSLGKTSSIKNTLIKADSTGITSSIPSMNDDNDADKKIVSVNSYTSDGEEFEIAHATNLKENLNSLHLDNQSNGKYQDRRIHSKVIDNCQFLEKNPENVLDNNNALVRYNEVIPNTFINEFNTHNIDGEYCNTAALACQEFDQVLHKVMEEQDNYKSSNLNKEEALHKLSSMRSSSSSPINTVVAEALKSAHLNLHFDSNEISTSNFNNVSGCIPNSCLSRSCFSIASCSQTVSLLEKNNLNDNLSFQSSASAAETQHFVMDSKNSVNLSTASKKTKTSDEFGLKVTSEVSSADINTKLLLDFGTQTDFPYSVKHDIATSVIQFSSIYIEDIEASLKSNELAEDDIQPKVMSNFSQVISNTDLDIDNCTDKSKSAPQETFENISEIARGLLHSSSHPLPSLPPTLDNGNNTSSLQFPLINEASLMSSSSSTIKLGSVCNQQPEEIVCETVIDRSTKNDSECKFTSTKDEEVNLSSKEDLSRLVLKLDSLIASLNNVGKKSHPCDVAEKLLTPQLKNKYGVSKSPVSPFRGSLSTNVHYTRQSPASLKNENNQNLKKFSVEDYSNISSFYNNPSYSPKPYDLLDSHQADKYKYSLSRNVHLERSLSNANNKSPYPITTSPARSKNYFLLDQSHSPKQQEQHNFTSSNDTADSSRTHISFLRSCINPILQVQISSPSKIPNKKFSPEVNFHQSNYDVGNTLKDLYPTEYPTKHSPLTQTKYIVEVSDGFNLDHVDYKHFPQYASRKKRISPHKDNYLSTLDLDSPEHGIKEVKRKYIRYLPLSAGGSAEVVSTVTRENTEELKQISSPNYKTR